MKLNQKKNKKNKGFYIALGVCLMAVGAAAWTTYDSVTDYTAPRSSEQSEAAKANDTVSGIFITEPEDSSESSSQTEVTANAEETSEPVTQSAASQEENEQTTAAATSFIRPVSGDVLQPFSKKPIYNKTLGDYRAHTGVDLAAEADEAVKSIGDGVVTGVETEGENGNTVSVQYGTLEVWYCGLDKISVTKDQNVSQGEQLGTVGVNPSESDEETHLHLAAKKDGEFEDPMTFLG